MAANIATLSVLGEISQGHLECPICSERFKQPKLLECSHSICLECLQQLSQKSQSTTKLSCPVCRKVTLLKENGIHGLTMDFKTISLIEAFEKQEIRLTQQQGQQVPSQEFVSKCSKHTDKDLIMYCEACKELICTTCIAKDHRLHPVMELNEASDKSKQHATELLAELTERIISFNIAIQEIDMSRKTLDSMFAATKDKLSNKADEEIAKEVARIRKEEQKLVQEAEQIYQDRVKTMETVRTTNSKEMNKAEHKQDEVNQLMDQGIKIVHQIEQLLQDLKEYREMKSTKVPDGLTYMDFKEDQKSLGRLVLKDEQQVQSATSAAAGQKHFKQNEWTFKSEKKTYKNRMQQMVESATSAVAPKLKGKLKQIFKQNEWTLKSEKRTYKNRMQQMVEISPWPEGSTYMDFKESATSAEAGQPTLKAKKHFKQKEWTFKSEKKSYNNIMQQMVGISPWDVATYSNSDIVVSDWNRNCLIAITAESNPQSTVIPQELSIKDLTKPSRVTVNKNNELIVLDDRKVKIFNRNNQLVHQFNPGTCRSSGSEPSCIAVDASNLIAVGYRNKAEISLHKPDGSLIRTLPAPGIDEYLTTYKQQLIYTNWGDMKLVSVEYNGKIVFSVDIHQSGQPRGVCCDNDGSIYVSIKTGTFLSLPGDILHYNPNGNYTGCMIKTCAAPRGITITPAGDLVMATDRSVQIYHRE